jgi:hypothetical protein
MLTAKPCVTFLTLVVESTLHTLWWERLRVKPASTAWKEHQGAKTPPVPTLTYRKYLSPASGQAMWTFTPENPNQCVNPEIPTSAFAEFLWQPPK